MRRIVSIPSIPGMKMSRNRRSKLPLSNASTAFCPSLATSTPWPARSSSRRTVINKVRKRAPETLRSARWFAPDDLRAFGHRSRAMQMGYAPQEWKDRPVIAILNPWSDAQPCHMHFKSRVDDVKRGILMAGGFPVELPALSLSESLLKPTTMLYRNLLAMDAEE